MMKKAAVIFSILFGSVISSHADDAIPNWVKELERFNIPFSIDWDVETLYRPNPNWAKIIREEGTPLPGNDSLRADRAEQGRVSKKKFSAKVASYNSYHVVLQDINISGDNSIRTYSGSPTEGSKFKSKHGPASFDEDPMRYFGDFSIGLLQTQVIAFLPSTTDAKIIQDDQWPKVYELSNDGPIPRSLRFFVRDDKNNPGSIEKIEVRKNGVKVEETVVTEWGKTEAWSVPVKAVQRRFDPKGELSSKSIWVMRSYQFPRKVALPK